MDVLLINTPIFRRGRDPDAEDSVPTLGLGYIYTGLTHAGYECQFIDAVVEALLPNKVLNIINESDARFVGLNVFSSNLDIVRDLVERVESPRRFLLGGPGARALLPEIESWRPNGSVTVVIGDAELLLPALVRNPAIAEQRSPLLSVATVMPGSPYYPHDIDLPLDRSIFRNEPVHRPGLGVIESHIITSRGCLYNCAFCTAATSVNQRTQPRYRSHDSLVEEIETIRKLHPETNCIRVLDDLFLRDHARIELGVRLFPESNMYWRSMAHINTFQSPDRSNELEIIKQSGCRELFFGIESGNDDTLRRIRKPFSAATAYETVCRVLDVQVPVKCYFILGFPGETESAANETIALASCLREHADKTGVRLRISPFRFRPYHGTALYDELIREGWTVTPIRNQADVRGTAANPYDCVSQVYAQYGENALDGFMERLRRLDVDTA